MPSLSKVAERDLLKPRRDPYWSKLSTGNYIGFRKMKSGSAGTWLARSYDDAVGKQLHKALGGFLELSGAMRYDAAKKAAEEWFAHLGKGGAARSLTVRGACQGYIDHLKHERRGKTAADVEGRFKRHVYPNTKFAETPLDKLKPVHVEAWRRALREGQGGPVKHRTDSAINRDLTALRAALNLAYRDGMVTTDFAWRTKLVAIKNADRRRDLYLDADQRRKFAAHAPQDLANFLRGLSLLPVRPGALAALTVGDFDPRLKTITIGKDKAGRDRKLTLPDATAAFFAFAAEGKPPSAPLLCRGDGKPWDKDAWKHPVKAAAAAAELPARTTCYSIRHSVITDLIHAGLDTLTVAQLAGTSVLMIEKHYGHLTQEHARKALALLVA